MVQNDDSYGRLLYLVRAKGAELVSKPWVYFVLVFSVLLCLLFISFVEYSSQEKPIFVNVYGPSEISTTVHDVASKDSSDFTLSYTPILNFGYTDKPVWLQISQDEFPYKTSVVELDFHQLDYVDLFVFNPETNKIVGHQVSGDRRSYSEKTYPSERILFKVERPKDKFEIYLRILTDGSNQAPLSITDIDKYLVQSDTTSALLHLFLGVALFASVLYSLYLYVYRDQAYFYYVTLNFSISLLLVFHYRLINVYTNMFSIEAQHLAILLSIMTAFYSGIKLVQVKFIQWGFYRFRRVLQVYSAGTLGIALICGLVSYQASLKMVFVYLAVVAPSIMYMLCFFIYNNKNSRYLNLGLSTALGWGVFIVAALAQILGEVGVISDVSLVNHGFLVGSLGIIFSMGLILSSSLKLEHEEKLQAEKELSVANERIYQADKLAAITTMSSGLIHEIKNPLNWSKGALVIALNENTDSSQEELLKDSLQGLERIEEIVSGLNWFAKAGPVELIPLNLKSLIDKTVSLAKSQINGVIIDNKVGEGVFLKASETHLAQVIINLLSNSIKAIAPVSKSRVGKIQINAVECTQSSTGLKQLKVSWKDNGVGMSTDQLNKLFDPFYTTSDMNQGIGLGMSVVKQIIEKHHGRIEASSDHYSWSEIHLFFNLT